MDNIELVDGLCTASVPLREARRLHVRAYGVLLPHVFMGEVLRRVGQCLALVATHDLDAYASELTRILEMLERGMAEGDRGPRTRAQLSVR